MSRQMYYDEEAGQFFPIPDVVEQKPITNADRIRAMSDEELARQLAFLEDFNYDEPRVLEWLEWLRQEAT